MLKNNDDSVLSIRPESHAIVLTAKFCHQQAQQACWINRYLWPRVCFAGKNLDFWG